MAMPPSYVIVRSGLAMITLCTKFEVTNFTHYGHIKGVAKCRKWGSLGSLAMSPFDRKNKDNHTALCN